LKKDRLTKFKGNGTTSTGIIRTRVGFPGSSLLDDEDISNILVIFVWIELQR
jgi:hypothetical protein